MSRNKRADIGIFGGSGLYSFLDNVKEVTVETPYGAPSDNVFVGEHAGKTIAFLPRHDRNHRIPPHKINYRANVWALKELGCSTVICPCAAGSLQKEYKPGEAGQNGSQSYYDSRENKHLFILPLFDKKRFFAFRENFPEYFLRYERHKGVEHLQAFLEYAP